MSTNQSFFVVGRKTCGQELCVAIYCHSEDEAERQYEFRYRGLGYLLPKDFTLTPEGDDIPLIQFRSRKQNELHQSYTEENSAEFLAGVDAYQGPLDYVQNEPRQDDQNVVYLGE